MTIQQLQQYPLGEKGLICQYDFKRIDGIIEKRLKKVFGINYPDGFYWQFIDRKGDLFLSDIKGGNETPILYLLSAITQEIEVYGERFVPMERIKEKNKRYDFDGTCIVEFHYDIGGNVKYKTIHESYGSLPYWILQLLQSWFINYQGIESVNPFDLEINPYK